MFKVLAKNFNTKAQRKYKEHKEKTKNLNVFFVFFVFLCAFVLKFLPKTIVTLCLFLVALVPQADAKKIGMKIWHNESAGKIEGLTCWNKGEEFASLGIGHFIWFPKGLSSPFTETFPELVKFIKAQGVSTPHWMGSECPWTNRESFLQDQHSTQMEELRQWLINTIDLQVLFIVERVKKALPALGEQKKITHLMSTPEGAYAVIDYINFKGEGTSPKERYKGEGWGLLQVLQEMPDHGSVAQFAEAAKKVLKRRVDNSPKERNEEKWLKGWYARIDTY